MKTLKSKSNQHLRLILRFLLCSTLMHAVVQAQVTEDDNTTNRPKIVRPESSDSSSLKLIQNYLTASGGKKVHNKLQNVKVTGEYREAKDSKNFTLIETFKGERYLQLNWKLRGIQYEQLYVYDGLEAWQRRTLPDDKKRNLPKAYNGLPANHFINQRWFFQPFIPPLSPKYVFEYSGTDKVASRPSYLVVGYGAKNERTWFYFDKETFLVTRWGGIGAVARGETYLDYQAKGFKKVDGLFLPTGLTLLAKGQPYGEVIFESIETNVDIEPGFFTEPVIQIPTLRTVPSK